MTDLLAKTSEFVAPVELVSMSEKQVIVTASTPASCARCAAGTGCGQAQFRILSLAGRGPMALSRSAVTATDLVVGEKLQLVMSTTAVLSCSLLLYGIPLLGLVSGALLGQFALDVFSSAGAIGESIPAVFAAAGLGLALLGVRKIPHQLFGWVRLHRELQPESRAPE